jgi:hypothetical protein
VNVLRDEEDPWLDADGKQIYSKVGPDRLESELSEQMVVPARLLKITYTPKEAGKADTLHVQRSRRAHCNCGASTLGAQLAEREGNEFETLAH